MQKQLPAIVLSLLLPTGLAYGDVLGVTLSAEHWWTGVSGSAGDHQFSQPLGFDDDQGNAWMLAFEHPLPLLPNVAVRQQYLSYLGVSRLAGTLRLNNQPFSAGTDITQQLQLDYTDGVFYYEVLDNPLLQLDLGLAVRQVELDLAVQQPQAAARSLSSTLPMLYLHGTTYLWGTDSYLFLQGGYADFHDQRWSDIRVGVGYELFDVTAMSLAVKLGWQQQDIKLLDKDQLDADLQLDGVFVALEVDF